MSAKIVKTEDLLVLTDEDYGTLDDFIDYLTELRDGLEPEKRDKTRVFFQWSDYGDGGTFHIQVVDTEPD